MKAIHVVECPEFQDLCMLLRESLTDKDIPRHDKLREAIIQQFLQEFECLKVELSVGYIQFPKIATNPSHGRSLLGMLV